MKLYFIGGASGSGKTAVMPNLKELLGDNIAVGLLCTSELFSDNILDYLMN